MWRAILLAMFTASCAKRDAAPPYKSYAGAWGIDPSVLETPLGVTGRATATFFEECDLECPIGTRCVTYSSIAGHYKACAIPCNIDTDCPSNKWYCNCEHNRHPDPLLCSGGVDHAPVLSCLLH
jgi:hypothetical protein